MKSNNYQRELNLILKEEKLIEIEIEINSEGITDEESKKSKRLLLLRKSHKLSRRELEEKTLISQSTIKKYENGGMVAQGGTLEKIANYYDVPLSYFTNPNEIIDTDLMLISSLKSYCWHLSVKRNKLDSIFTNGAEIDESPFYSEKLIWLSIISACQIAIGCLPDTNDYRGSCYYIAKCLAIDTAEYNLRQDLENGPVRKLKKRFIEELSEFSNTFNLNEDIKRDVSIDSLFSIIDFLVCNRRIVDKSNYINIIVTLRPLIEIYKEYLKTKSEKIN